MRGSKEKFLSLWANKYDFKLTQQKAREWEKQFVLNKEASTKHEDECTTNLKVRICDTKICAFLIYYACR